MTAECLSKPIFFVIGATGCGKTDAAVQLAHQLQKSYNYTDVVVLNCDVAQFYEDLPIGTNMITSVERQGITHVFMGFLNFSGQLIRQPDEPFLGCDVPHISSAAAESGGGGDYTIHRFTEDATRFIESYFSTNPDGAVVVCGGTFYYAQSLLFSNAIQQGSCQDTEPEATPSDPQSVEVEDSELWTRMNAIDPAVATRYHPNDHRRLRRLLEIHRSTGEIPSKLFSGRAKLRFAPERCFVIWVSVERSVLSCSLDSRVDVMLQRGLLSEVASLQTRARGTPKNSLLESIGYKELAPVSHLGIDDAAVAEAVHVVKSNTRRYARKQVQWIENRMIPLLASCKVPLPPHHFVKVALHAKTDLSPSVGTVLRSFLSDSPPPVTDAFSFPLLAPREVTAPVTQEVCPLCDTVVYGRDQMTTHLKSKRHRGALKRRALEEEQLARFGRVLPPQKKRRTSSGP